MGDILTSIFVYTLFATFALLLILACVGRCLGWSDPSAPTRIRKKKTSLEKGLDNVRYRESFSNIRHIRSLKYKSQQHLLELKSKNYVLDKWKYHSSVRIAAENGGDENTQLSPKHELSKSVMLSAMRSPATMSSTPSEHQKNQAQLPKFSTKKVVPISNNNTVTTTITTTKFDLWKFGWTTTTTTVSTQADADDGKSNGVEQQNKEEEDPFDLESQSPLLPKKFAPLTPNRQEGGDTSQLNNEEAATANSQIQQVTDPNLSNRVEQLESLLVTISNKLEHTSTGATTGGGENSLSSTIRSPTIDKEELSNSESQLEQSQSQHDGPLSVPASIQPLNLSRSAEKAKVTQPKTKSSGEIGPSSSSSSSSGNQVASSNDTANRAVSSDGQSSASSSRNMATQSELDSLLSKLHRKQKELKGSGGGVGGGGDLAIVKNADSVKKTGELKEKKSKKSKSSPPTSPSPPGSPDLSSSSSSSRAYKGDNRILTSPSSSSGVVDDSVGTPQRILPPLSKVPIITSPSININTTMLSE